MVRAILMFLLVTGPVSAEPLLIQPTYVAINAHIFSSRCSQCHNPDGKAKKIPLWDYMKMLMSPRKIVIPFHVEASGLMEAITRTDSKRMPPPNVGDRLTDLEISIIETWIENGAPFE